jgi:hypothetical protein
VDKLAVALLVVNILVSAWLLWRQLRLRRELRTAQLAVAGLGAAPLPPPRPGSLIAVEVLNPMELALRDSRLARSFGSLAPELVRREVYREVSKRMAVQLQEQGVVADLKIHDRPA